MSPISPSPPLYTARLLRAHSKHGLWPTRLQGEVPFWFPLLLVVVSATLVFVSFLALDFLGNKVSPAICAGAAVLISSVIILRSRRSD